MLPYLLVMALALVLGVIVCPERSLKRKKLYLVLIFSAIFLLAACRSVTVGVDTAMHCKAYRTISLLSYSGMDAITDRFEIGFVLLCKMLSLLNSSYQLLIVVSSAIICLCAAYFIYSLADEPVLPTVLYLCLLFPNYLNIMREAIAVAIGMLAIVALTRQKNIPFILLVLLASLFHRSAIVLLLLLPLQVVDINWKSLSVLLITGLLLFLFAEKFLQVIATFLGKTSFYDENFMGSNYFGALVQFLFELTLCIVYFNYVCLSHRSGRLHMDSQMELVFGWSLLLWLLLSAVGMKVEIVSRFSYYFAPLILCALPISLRVPTKKEALLVGYVLMVIAIVYFIVIEALRPEWHGIVPYVLAGFGTGSFSFV